MYVYAISPSAAHRKEIRVVLQIGLQWSNRHIEFSRVLPYSITPEFVIQ